MTRTETTPAMPELTRTERKALRVIRKSYRQSRDLFSETELAKLTFIRWLYQTGRIDS